MRLHPRSFVKSLFALCSGLSALAVSAAPIPVETSASYATTLRTTLNNLSTRGHVGPGDDVLIAGFVIRGHQQKNVLIRAVGPTLSEYHVQGALADPTIELYGATGLIATNDDWMVPSDKGYVIEAAAKTAGAFPLPRASKDAALYQNLSEGGYTAVVRTKGMQAGEALIELYDHSCQCSNMINVSARAFMQPKGGVQIAGFNISGTESKKVLIRAAGPSLGALGLKNALANPRMTVYRAADNVEIATNDDWSGDSTQADLVAATSEKAGAFAWTRGSKDAAVVLTLAPGLYSAVVSDVDDKGGICLVEVYDAD